MIAALCTVGEKLQKKLKFINLCIKQDCDCVNEELINSSEVRVNSEVSFGLLPAVQYSKTCLKRSLKIDKTKVVMTNGS